MSLYNSSDTCKRRFCLPNAIRNFGNCLVQLSKGCITTTLLHCLDYCFMLFHNHCNPMLMIYIIEKINMLPVYTIMHLCREKAYQCLNQQAFSGGKSIVLAG